jgi:glycerol-3-phosphate dehydrogenase
MNIIVIGGGIIGTFIAYEVSKNHSVTLIEKEHDLSQVQTTHNSALVHSPVLIPPKKGELKAKFTIEGNQFFHDNALKLGVPTLKNGAFLVALNDEEMNQAKEYYEAALKRGIKDVKLLSGAAMKIAEPNLSDEVVGGLDLPTALTADTYILSKTLEAGAIKNQASFIYNEAVSAIKKTEDQFEVSTHQGKTYYADKVINAAGIHAETIASMIEKKVPYKSRPNRGEYYVLKGVPDLVSKTLFPLPNKITKGILVIPQPDGTIRLGPTSQYQTSLTDDTVSDEGLNQVKEGVLRLLKYVPFDKVVKEYVGIRATIDHDDFYIQESKEVKGFIHVAGIDSPGVTASPAIANYVAKLI